MYEFGIFTRLSCSKSAVDSMSYLRRPQSFSPSASKTFVVKSLAKCGLDGDLDCTVVYTSDPEFSNNVPDGQPLGFGSSRYDTCNVRIQFQQKGKIESLGSEDGVIRSEAGALFAFKSSDLYFDAELGEHEPYNSKWADLAVGQDVFFIPFRNVGGLRGKGSQSAPVLKRALSVTRQERAVTCRVEIDSRVPHGAIAIPKWMWPSLCPLTAAESGEVAVAAPVASSAAVAPGLPSSSAAAAEEHPNAASARAPPALDGLRERTVRATMVFSSQLPIVEGIAVHCVSKRSLDPSSPVPNFTELSNWLETFQFLVGSGVCKRAVELLANAPSYNSALS